MCAAVVWRVSAHTKSRCARVHAHALFCMLMREGHADFSRLLLRLASRRSLGTITDGTCAGKQNSSSDSTEGSAGKQASLLVSRCCSCISPPTRNASCIACSRAPSNTTCSNKLPAMPARQAALFPAAFSARPPGIGRLAPAARCCSGKPESTWSGSAAPDAGGFFSPSPVSHVIAYGLEAAAGCCSISCFCCEDTRSSR